ncbi:hypothetical protein GIB67_035376, partial [Kingdonia uniflora]
MGLTISNPDISNIINRDISQACLIMNTALLAMANPINTNIILESDHSATTVNSSAIMSAVAKTSFIQSSIVYQQCQKRKVDVAILGNNIFISYSFTQ